MIDNNFKCNGCQQEWHEVHYRFTYTDKGLVYRGKTGGDIFCPQCQCENVDFIRHNTNFEGIKLGSYASASPQKRKEIVVKRHKKHAKKNADYKVHKEKELRKKIMGI